MPESRKRKGHHEYRKPSDIPATQRTKGRILWALLFAVFGFILLFFALGLNWIALIIGTFLASILGYLAGIKMEKAAKNQ